MSEDRYFKRKRTIEEQPQEAFQEADIEPAKEEGGVVLPAPVERQPLTISAEKEDILQRIRETDSIDELKDLANLFGVSLTKKEIERASRESDLIDTLLSHAEERIAVRGGNLSNEELLEYLKTFQSNVDKSKRSLNSDVEDASSKYTATHNEVNITVNNVGSELPRDSREKILDVVNAILSQEQSRGSIIIDPEEVDLTGDDGEEGI